MRDSDGVRNEPGRRASVLASATFVAIVIAGIVIRARALAELPSYASFDGGDWLAIGRGLFGVDVRPTGTAAAPLAPLITWGTVELLGPRAAFITLGAVASVAPGCGAFVVLRRWISPFVATFAAGLLVFGAAAGEAASWGGYPQLIGLGLLPVALALIDAALRSPTVRLCFAAAAAVLAVALASDFVFVMLGLCALVLALMHLTATRDVRALLRVGGAVALGMLLVVPLYIKLLSVRVQSVTDPAPLLGRDDRSPFARVEAVWFDAPTLWRIIVLAGVVAVPLWWRRRAEPLWRLAAALTLSAVGVIAISPESRLAYFLPTAAVFGVALWDTDLVSEATRIAMSVLLGAGLVLQLGLLPTTAVQQGRRYSALNDGLVTAMNWVRRSTPPDAVVAVTSYRETPTLAWWVEGLAERKTLAQTSTQWVYFPSERRNAALAGRIFAAGVPTPRLLHRANQLGADFVLLDKRWTDYATSRIEFLRAADEGFVAFENDAAVVLRTAPHEEGAAS